MSQSVLRERAKAFAKNIIYLVEKIKSGKKDHVLTSQLLRSGTSIGANIYEARYAQSNLDFISKLEIALKESYETEYWLELIFDAGYIDAKTFEQYNSECGSLRKMLISSCKTAKSKLL